MRLATEPDVQTPEDAVEEAALDVMLKEIPDIFCYDRFGADGEAVIHT